MGTLPLNNKMRGFVRKGKLGELGPNPQASTSYGNPSEERESEMREERGHLSLMRGEFSFDN